MTPEESQRSLCKLRYLSQSKFQGVLGCGSADDERAIYNILSATQKLKVKA